MKLLRKTKKKHHKRCFFLVICEEVIKINILKTNELSFYNDFGILTLNAKQFDTGRIFVFNIMDNDEPFDLSGCEAYLRMAKADGTQFQGHECCTISGSTITVNTGIGNGDQILAAAGINKCELHLKNTDETALTTWTFNISVEKRVHDGSNISSINSYDILDNMINMEKERIENEQIRKNNESKRINNEDQRVLDENERKENEAERKKTFGNVLAEVKSYATTASICTFNAKVSEMNSKDSELNAYNSAKESESFAHGKTGTRDNEDIDNSEFWCRMSKNYKETSENLLEEATKLLQETNWKIVNLELEVNDNGELEYESDIYDFEINDDGELEYWLSEEGSFI